MHTYYFEFANDDRTYVQKGETTAANIVDAFATATRWVAEDWEGMEVTKIEEVGQLPLGRNADRITA